MSSNKIDYSFIIPPEESLAAFFGPLPGVAIIGFLLSIIIAVLKTCVLKIYIENYLKLENHRYEFFEEFLNTWLLLNKIWFWLCLLGWNVYIAIFLWKESISPWEFFQLPSFQMITTIVGFVAALIGIYTFIKNTD